MSHAVAPAAPPASESKKGFMGLSLSQWIIASMVVGIIVGWAFPDSARASHSGWACLLYTSPSPRD